MIIQSIKDAQYGDIIFFKPLNAWGKIQVAIDCIGQKPQPYSHVSLFYEHMFDTPLMIESASHCGVHITKVQEWRNYVIFRPDKTYLKSIEIVTKECGKAYDFNSIIAILKNRLFGIEIEPNDDTRPICSEFINFTYSYMIDIKGYCTPVTLANKLLCK